LTGVFTASNIGSIQLRLGHVSTNLNAVYFDNVSVTPFQTRDGSLYANHSDILGSTRTGNGKRGGAYSFSNSAYLKTILPTVPTTAYTISAWIKLSELGREQHIADFTNNQFYVGSNNKLGTAPRSSAGGTTTLNQNTRYFVTLTRDQTKTTLYLNGDKENEGSAGTDPSNPLIIGHLYTLVGNY
jgi:hypothetical protein